MIEVRIHGRGGQGNVVAAYLLATAAIDEGHFGQAFPAFGAERRGAPVVAFVRIAGQVLRRHNQVLHPDFLIIQDHALLHVPGVLDGLRPNGGILVNTTLDVSALEAQLGRAAIALPATQLAKAHLGRPVPNTALLSAFLALTQMLPMHALAGALGQKFKGELLERNLRLIEAAAQQVPAGLWKEVAHATGA
ncbi:MAG: 2-oxoacid:acceptor oxidoreductase family protein [Pseudomonadota bacterium]